jgi:hypothetical protein
MVEHGRSTSHTGARALAAVLCLALGGIGVSSAQVDISSTTTSMTSTTKRMVSYRNQRHSWQTADGAIHLMVNVGTLPSKESLTLYSSFDGGVTWTAQFALADTDGFSTSDGALTNTGAGHAVLQLAYGTTTGSGEIRFVSAAYDGATQAWTVGTPEVAYAERGQLASMPAFAADSDGNLWCGFTLEDRGTQLYNLQLLYQAAGSGRWTNTGLVFGGTDTSTQHAARPILIDGGIGMVYQADATMYWAYRVSGAPVDSPWNSSELYAGLPPSAADPYDTHFSVDADASNNLFLAFAGANGVLDYLRYTASSATWGPVETLTPSSASSAYMQVVVADGNVVLLTNAGSSIDVFQSTDDGLTFTLTQQLVHPTPPKGSPLDYQNPRVEAPAIATSPIPVWQQFFYGSTQGLMFFPVPVIGPGAD